MASGSKLRRAFHFWGLFRQRRNCVLILHFSCLKWLSNLARRKSKMLRKYRISCSHSSSPKHCAKTTAAPSFWPSEALSWQILWTAAWRMSVTLRLHVKSAVESQWKPFERRAAQCLSKNWNIFCSSIDSGCFQWIESHSLGNQRWAKSNPHRSRRRCTVPKIQCCAWKGMSIDEVRELLRRC